MYTVLSSPSRGHRSWSSSNATPSADGMPTVELANGPLAAVAALGGDVRDVDPAHDEAALTRLTALAKAGATYSPLLLRHRSCFWWRWTRYWAIIEGGVLRLFHDEAAEQSFREYQVKECDCHVGELEECKTDNYCFRLSHAKGSATFCAFSSKQLLLWLQALQSSGVKYEDDMTAAGSRPERVSSLFQLRANLLSGEPVELSQYTGCVCLVVNAASK